MAHIRLFILVEDAASAEEAEQLAMKLLLATKPVKTQMEAAGHRIIAKAAIPCECCGEMVDVRWRGLCPTCGGDAVVDRQLELLHETVTIPMPDAAEAVF